MLSANQSTPLRDGKQFEYGVKANAQIYGGGLVEANGNHVQRASAGAGKTYHGVAQEGAAGGAADGDVKVLVQRRLAAKFKTIETGRNTVPGLGATAYVHDDETVTGTNDVAGANVVDRSALGKVVAVEDDGVWVFFE